MFSNKKFMYWMTEMTGHTVIFFQDGEGLGIKTSSNTKYLFSFICTMYKANGAGYRCVF